MADWYASTTGNSGNAGSLGSPWDLTTALAATGSIAAGDTLYLLGGTYFYPTRTVGTSGYVFSLRGAAGNPIVIRPYDGQRVTIDGGLQGAASPNEPRYVIVRDLEIIVSENLTQTRISATASTPPPDLVRPWGSLEVAAGTDIKFINNVIHHNMQGIGFWRNVVANSELYGNIIYENGWIGSDRSHGHGIYSQNDTATRKFIRNNILLENYSFNLHCYGSGDAFVDNYTVEQNISAGGPRGLPGTIRNFLIGGQKSTSNTGHVIDANYCWHSKLQVGRAPDLVSDTTVSNNHVVLEELVVQVGSNVTQTGNFSWKENSHGTLCNLNPAPEGGAPTPTGPDIFLTANTYDSARAHLAIYNYFLDAEVDVDFGSFLSNGQQFMLKDPRDFYGSPVYANTYAGATLAIPTGGEMFLAFVVLQGSPDLPVSVPGSGDFAMGIKKGSIDQTENFILLDSTTGQPKTGVTLTTIDLTYTRIRAAHVKADATALASITAAHSDWGAFEVSATETPGQYRADFPDAAFATGSPKVILGMTAPDCAPAYKEIILLDADSSDVADIETALTTGTVNANLVAISGATSGVIGFDMATRSITTGTADAGATTTSLTTKTLDPYATVDKFKAQVLAFDRDTLTAALRGQKAVISANTVSTDTGTGEGAVLTYTELTVAPAEDESFTIQ